MEDFSRDSLEQKIDKLSMSELKSILKHYKLRVGGKRIELIERIKEYWSNSNDDVVVEKGKNKEKQEKEKDIKSNIKRPSTKERNVEDLLLGMLPVLMTGIREGEYLVGIDKQSQNGVIKLVKGSIPPHKDVLRQTKK